MGRKGTAPTRSLHRLRITPTIPRVKPWQRTALRVAASVVLLGVLIWRLPDVEWRDVVPDWSGSTPYWLAGAVAVTLCAYAFQTLRWHVVLRAFDAEVPFRRLFSHFFAGQFISNVLPTAFGGDVVRVARVGADLDDWATAFASVTLERLTGWIVLPLISLVAIGLQPGVRAGVHATQVAVAVCVVTLVALVVILSVAALPAWSARAQAAVGWRRWIGAIHIGTDALRRRPTRAAEVLAAGICFQVLLCVSTWMIARGIGVDAVTLGASLAFFPAAAIIQNLPIGIGGLGVRESAFVLFFGALGATNGEAIGLGLAVYFVTVFSSALGAPFFIAGGVTGDTPSPPTAT